MSLELLTELKRLLEAEFSQTEFRKAPAMPEAYGPPAVHLQALPTKRGQARTSESQDFKEEFPFLILRCVSGEDGEADGFHALGATLDVRIICGVFTAGEYADGAMDLEAVLARVRRLLMRNRLLLSRYERQLPVKWSVGEGEDHGQPHPYHGGVLRVGFQAPGFDEISETDEEVATYGQLEA